MKTKILLSVTLLLAVLPVKAQYDGYKNPDEANYVIFGNMHNDFSGDEQVFTLDNVRSKGIQFTHKTVYHGDFDGVQKVGFTFNNAKTDNPNGFKDGFILWKRTKDVDGEYFWKAESEKNDSKEMFERKNIISIMLVLDCSGSMSDDGCQNMTIMKREARSFLYKLYTASSAGNIRVGLICFNTQTYADKHTYAPRPLNSENYTFLRNKIDSIPAAPRSSTALYYSVDKAVELLQKDYNSLNKSLFTSATLVAFTDGDDNNSTSKQKRIPTSEDYMNYLQSNYSNYTIGNYPILNSTYIMGLRGQENGKPMDDRSWRTMKYNLTQAFGDKAFMPIESINQLSNMFTRIAEDLINRYTTLKCEVPSGYKDEIAWTLKEVKSVPKPAPTPKPTPKLTDKLATWVGIDFSSAFIPGLDSWSWGGNYDMVFYMDRSIAFGGRMYLGGGYYYDPHHTNFFGFMFGPDVQFALYDIGSRSHGSITVCTGAGMMCDEGAFYLGFIYKPLFSFYVRADYMLVGGASGFGFGAGFSFGGWDKYK